MSNVIGTTIYAATWLCVTEQKGKSRVIITNEKVGGILEASIDDLVKVSKKKDIDEPIVFAAFNQMGMVVGLANKNQIVYDRGVYGRCADIDVKFLLSYPVRQNAIGNNVDWSFVKKLRVNDVELQVPFNRSFDDDLLAYRQIPKPNVGSKPDIIRWLVYEFGYVVVNNTLTEQEKRKKKRVEDIG